MLNTAGNRLMMLDKVFFGDDAVLPSLTEYSAAKYDQTVKVSDFLQQQAVVVDSFGDQSHNLYLI